MFTQTKKWLVAIDFDNTIVKGHTPGIIEVAGINDTPPADQEALKKWQWEQVKNVPTVGDKQAWHALFIALIQQNHLVCIVSSNPHKHIISQYMQDVLQLEQEYLSQIPIIIIQKAIHPGKTKHIEKAKQCFKNKKYDQIVLVDDEEDNIESARKKGYETITADTDTGEHLNKLITLTGLPFSILPTKNDLDNKEEDAPFSTHKLEMNHYRTIKHSIFYHPPAQSSKSYNKLEKIAISP